MTPTLFSRTNWDRRKVGILGGSFNPAHEGHRHISLLALNRLGLDAVWWLVTPQNPLKSTAETAALDTRAARAKDIAQHPRIHVSTLEKDLGTHYTVDTLKALRQRFPETDFVWIMGSDNLRQFHRWKGWRDIFKTVPVCVVARPPAEDALCASPAAAACRDHLLPETAARSLPGHACPAWIFLRGALNETSSTALRRAGLWTA